MLFKFKELFIAVSYDFVGSLTNFKISVFGRRTFALVFSTMSLCTFRFVLVEKLLFRNSQNRAMFYLVYVS